MFRVEAKIRVGSEARNTDIYLFGRVHFYMYVVSCADFEWYKYVEQALLCILVNFIISTYLYCKTMKAVPWYNVGELFNVITAKL